MLREYKRKLDIMKLKLPKHKQICTFDPDSMEYKHIKKRTVITYTIAVVLFCIVLGFIIKTSTIKYAESKEIDYEEVPIIIKQDLEFSEQKLWDLLVSMNVRFPHIVIAQARIESGTYTSDIFKENNNMFGMKCATSRATTHKGENRNHAMFSSWQECAIDYAFYQTTYMRKCKTENQYLEALSATYAEAGSSYGVSVRAEAKEVLKKYSNDKSSAAYTSYTMADDSI